MILRPEGKVNFTGTGTKTVDQGVGSVIISGSGTLASMTINFPPSPSDRDNLLIFFGVGITILTLAGGAIPINIGTLTMATSSGSVMCFEYEQITGKWYKLF